MSQSAKAFLEAKKAKIFADAQAAAAELDRDLVELERLAAKHGFVVSPSTIGEGTPGLEMKIVSDLSKMSASKAAPEAAVTMLRDKPAVRVTDVLQYLTQREIRIGGKRPLSTLSAYLSADARLQPASKGWWKLSGEDQSKLSFPRAADITVNGSGKGHGA